MLAPLSMIATVTAFSLFTAYQFLSSDMCIDTPESKMRPFPSWVYQWVCDCMMEMIATSFFFAYCVSNFECWFYCEKALTAAWIRVTIQHLQKEDEVFSALCWLILSDHMFIISFCEADHMWRLVCLFCTLYVFLLCRRSDFRAILPPENKTTWPSFGTRIWPHLWP